MNMVIPNEGKQKWLEYAFGYLDPTAPIYIARLYQNDYTPVDGSGPGDFTECTFSGYTPVPNGPTDWDAPTVVSNEGVIDATVAPTFTATAGTSNTAYGWYMTDSASGVVMAAQRFDTPRVMSAGAIEILSPFRFRLKTLD